MTTPSDAYDGPRPPVPLSPTRAHGRRRVQARRPEASSMRTWAEASLGALGVGILLAVAGPQVSGQPFTTDHLLIGISTTLMLLPAFFAMRKPGGDVFAPLPIVGAMLVLYFPVRALYLMNVSDLAEHVPPHLGNELDRWLAPALGLMTVCWVALMVGYLLPLAPWVARTAPLPKLFAREVVPSRVIGVFVLSIVFKGAQILRGTHLAFTADGSADLDTQAYVDHLSGLGQTALFLLAVLYAQRRLSRSNTVLLLGVFLPIEVLYGLATGSKLRVMTTVLTMMLAWHYFRNRIQFRHFAAFAALFAFVVTPIVTQLRSDYSRGEVSSGNGDFTVGAQSAALAHAAQGASEHDDFAEEAVANVSDRFHGLDSVMIALKMTPAVLPWSDPTLYALFPVMAVVPRILWKNKPKMILIPEWESAYWGMPSENPTSIARSHVGALYVCFGEVGAVVGMFLLGLFWRVVTTYLERQPGPITRLFQISFLTAILRIEGDIPSIYSGVVKMMIVLVIIVWGATAAPTPAQGASMTRRMLRARSA